jgi:hypothetical protein
MSEYTTNKLNEMANDNQQPTKTQKQKLHLQLSLLRGFLRHDTVTGVEECTRAFYTHNQTKLWTPFKAL